MNRNQKKSISLGVLKPEEDLLQGTFKFFKSTGTLNSEFTLLQIL